jgi:hypothetical protein
MLWGAVVLLVLLTGAWFLWSGHDTVTTSVDAQDTGTTVVDQYTVRISFDLSVTPGRAASCALQAQNESHGIVGWKIVAIPASETFTRSFTETVRTAQPALVGLIYKCWLT